MQDRPDRVYRLLFAGTTFTVGGAERIFSHLVTGLNRSPFQVEVLALRGPGLIGEELSLRGIKVHSGLTGEGRIDPFLPLRLRRLLRAGRYDAVYLLDHAHAVFYVTMASLGTDVRVRLMPVHTTGQWGGRPSLRRPIRLVLGKLTRIIAIAEAQRRYLIEEEGVLAEKLVVIPNGIPLEGPPAETRRQRRLDVRAEFGIPEDRPVIGITAVLRPEKNHELLLSALARIGPRLSGVEAWIVGDGPRRAFLEEEARRLGLEVTGPPVAAAGTVARGQPPSRETPVVRFFGQRADARRLMAAFDVAVLCSHPRVETLPLSLIEAMDAGLPVVATRVGALPEMVEDGVSGLLVPAGDAGALAQALEKVLADPSLRQAMGERGQAIARERYAVEGMVEKTERLLLSLLGDRG